MAFTPLHDSVHYGISSRHRGLNDWVGRLCGVPLNAPMNVFRIVSVPARVTSPLWNSSARAMAARPHPPQPQPTHTLPVRTRPA